MEQKKNLKDGPLYNLLGTILASRYLVESLSYEVIQINCPHCLKFKTIQKPNYNLTYL